MFAIDPKILESLQSVASNAIEAIVEVREREELRKLADPCLWERAHQIHRQRLRKIRFIARFHHQRKADHFGSVCQAMHELAAKKCPTLVDPLAKVCQSLRQHEV